MSQKPSPPACTYVLMKARVNCAALTPLYKCPPERLPKHPHHTVTGKVLSSGYIYLKYGGKDPTKFSPGEVAVHHMRHVLPVEECARMHITISFLEKLRKKLEDPSKIQCIGNDVRYTRFYRLVDVVRKPVPIPEKDVLGRIGKEVFLTALRAGGKFLTAQHDDPLPLTLSDMLKKETNAACLFSLSTRNGKPQVYCQALFIGTPGHIIWACVLRVYAQRRFSWQIRARRVFPSVFVEAVVEPEAKRARR